MKITIEISEWKDYDERSIPFNKSEFEKDMNEDFNLLMEAYDQWYGMFITNIEYDYTKRLVEFDEDLDEIVEVQ